MATTNFRVSKALQTYLAKQLAPMLLKIGAFKFSESREEYKIQTVLGELFVSIHDNWVHCCFDDIEKAKAHFHIMGIHHGRLNPCSGKWNWHWFDVNSDVVDPEKRLKNPVKTHLKLLAEVVWREIEDLTPAAVEKSKQILAEHDRLVKAGK